MIYNDNSVSDKRFLIPTQKIVDSQVTDGQCDSPTQVNTNSTSDGQNETQCLLDVVEGEWGMKLYIWNRDCIPGPSIADTIVNGIGNSKSVIIIHSSELFDLPDEVYKPPYSRIPTVDYGHIENQYTIDNTCTLKDDYALSKPHDMQNGCVPGQVSEWMDLKLLTVMRLIKSKPICVIRRGNISAKQVDRQYYPLLFPNEYLSPVQVIKESSPHMYAKLRMFLQD